MKPIYSLIAFQSLNQASYTGTRFLVALYAVQLQASVFTVGLLVALFALAPTLGSVPAGRLVDRVGTRAPVLVYLTLITAGCALPVLGLGMPALYLAAPLVGGAYFALYVAGNTLVNSYSPAKDRAANFSRLTVGISIAQALGPMAGGLLVDNVGFGAAFLLMAALPPLSHVLFSYAKLQHLGPRQGSTPNASKAKASAYELLRHPDLLPVYILSTLFIFAVDIFIVMLPIYGTQLKLSASQMGVIMSCFSVAAFVVRALSAVLARRYTPWQLMLLALLVTGVGSVLFGLVSAVPLLMLFAFIMGLGQGMGAPMSNTALYEVAPRERVSEAMGLRLSTGMAAQTALPLVIGSAGSFVAASWIFGATGLVLFASVYMQRRHWHRPAARSG